MPNFELNLQRSLFVTPFPTNYYISKEKGNSMNKMETQYFSLTQSWLTFDPLVIQRGLISQEVQQFAAKVVVEILLDESESDLHSRRRDSWGPSYLFFLSSLHGISFVKLFSHAVDKTYRIYANRSRPSIILDSDFPGFYQSQFEFQ